MLEQFLEGGGALRGAQAEPMRGSKKRKGIGPQGEGEEGARLRLGVQTIGASKVYAKLRKLWESDGVRGVAEGASLAPLVGSTEHQGGALATPGVPVSSRGDIGKLSQA